MAKRLFLLLFFACFGVTTEICFVAFTNLFNNEPFCNEPLWSLTGKTYVWMLPIHALVAVLGGLFFNLFQRFAAPIRWGIYVLAILTIEFITGGLLELITGKCPWEYTTGWHLMGYIRIDYAPAWFIYSAVIETLYLYLDRNLKK